MELLFFVLFEKVFKFVLKQDNSFIFAIQWFNFNTNYRKFQSFSIAYFAVLNVKNFFYVFHFCKEVFLPNQNFSKFSFFLSKMYLSGNCITCINALGRLTMKKWSALLSWDGRGFCKNGRKHFGLYDTHFFFSLHFSLQLYRCMGTRNTTHLK